MKKNMMAALILTCNNNKVWLNAFVVSFEDKTLQNNESLNLRYLRVFFGKGLKIIYKRTSIVTIASQFKLLRTSFFINQSSKLILHHCSYKEHYYTTI